MVSEEIHQRAIKYIKENKKELFEKFAGDNICPSQENPISIFMAGSPGAGKTEFSKNLIKDFQLEIIRIDADDIRGWIPGYNGKNSDDVQGASALGVEKIYDYVLKKKKSCLLDATFANFKISSENICRSIQKKRPVVIYYIYQDPIVAWKFTKAREIVEGRVVPKDIFIKSFFQAKNNVNAIKEIYGKNVRLNIVEKNLENNKLENLYLNIDKIDNYIKIDYNEETLIPLL
jgi:UDP-N-acetylglucosamine kinase